MATYDKDHAQNSVLPMPHGVRVAHTYMGYALEQARSTPRNDIPIGALVIDPAGNIIGRGTNRRETDHDPLGHAEIMAIRQAAAHFPHQWRLTNCTLVVTVEPCSMCAGAAVGARIGKIIFGAFEQKTGACGSVFDVVRDSHVLHSVEVIGGVREEECAALVSEFFQDRRQQK